MFDFLSDKTTHLAQNIMLLLITVFTLTIFIFLLFDDLNIPQKEMVKVVNIKNHINICLPDKTLEE
jgi:hypothetical protein